MRGRTGGWDEGIKVTPDEGSKISANKDWYCSSLSKMAASSAKCRNRFRLQKCTRGRADSEKLVQEILREEGRVAVAASIPI